MIEVERQFKISTAIAEQLSAEADLVSQKEIHDIYFDDAQYSLTCKDFWLRQRDGNYELKIPSQHASEHEIDCYHELETEKEIMKALEFESGVILGKALQDNNITPFAEFITKRIEYQYKGCTIVIDQMSFGYEVAEIEILVKDEYEVAGAVLKIKEVANQLGIEDEMPTDKLIEYLLRNNKEHIAVLQDAKII